ncbi:hypothetical protein FHR76_003065 [Rhizobium sp. RAS22]|nr:hypothetical protein [Rhizobium sp. RAS22]
MWEWDSGYVASVELDAADRQRSSGLTCGLHRWLTFKCVLRLTENQISPTGRHKSR